MTLDQIACTEITDRSSKGHDYMRTYGELFGPIRNSIVTLLEMGVLGGAGLRTWGHYFTHPAARIIGLDPHTEVCGELKDDRIRLIRGSQADTAFLNSIFDSTRFEICIDDAGHFSSAQVKAFEFFWPRVFPGGFYCIEDLHSYAAPELCDGNENIMAFLTRIATEMQGRGGKALGRSEPFDLWPDIDLIMFRKGLCVLRKRV